MCMHVCRQKPIEVTEDGSEVMHKYKFHSLCSLASANVRRYMCMLSIYLSIYLCICLSISLHVQVSLVSVDGLVFQLHMMQDAVTLKSPDLTELQLCVPCP